MPSEVSATADTTLVMLIQLNFPRRCKPQGGHESMWGPESFFRNAGITEESEWRGGGPAAEGRRTEISDGLQDFGKRAGDIDTTADPGHWVRGQ